MFWWLSAERYTITLKGLLPGSDSDFLPGIVLLAAPLCAVFVMIYITAVGRTSWRLSALSGIILLAAGAYVLVAYPQLGIRLFQEQYLTLMAIHCLFWPGWV